jgi:TonB family protein
LHRVTPLVAPRFHLTQKDPNKGKPTQELSLASAPSQQATKESTAHSKPAPQLRTAEAPPAAPKLSEPPAIQAELSVPALAPQAGVVQAPPPKPAPTPPKLAFETPGQGGSAPIPGRAKIAPPKTGLDDAIKSVARSVGPGTAAFTEMDPAPDLPDSLRASQINGASKILPELLSDPQGVDFKPYIIRVLSLVRRNWIAIIPESAHMGHRGVVTLQFIVDRNGQVPKLVIASPSGADALDRAAVAGVSASVPLPPLPAEFQGKEVRLQFSFKYNVQ